MMNKKVLAVMMAVVVILALVLVGCGKPSEHIVPGSSSANGTGVEDWDDVVNNNGGNAEQSGSASGSASDSSGSSSGSSSGNKSSSSSSSGVGQEDYGITYEEYLAMDAYEQQAYFEELGWDEYIKWYNAAKKDYDARQDAIRVEGDGGFNIGDYLN